jgi:hypothetical protein
MNWKGTNPRRRRWVVRVATVRGFEYAKLQGKTSQVDLLIEWRFAGARQWSRRRSF